MKIFLDSSHIEDIAQAYEVGIIDGITTNPSLIKKAVTQLHESHSKETLKDYISRLLSIARGTPVSLEVTADTYDEIVAQGEQLYKTFNPIARNVCIKIPINPAYKKTDQTSMDGIRAIKTLSQQGIPINTTLVFTPEQALLAAKAGASFVSPFIGRTDDTLRKNNKVSFKKGDYFPADGMTFKKKILEDNGIVSGIDLVAQIVTLFRQHDIQTEVLAASLRSARQVREAALVGADIATISFSVFKELFDHPNTRSGMKMFTDDIVDEYQKITRGENE